MRSRYCADCYPVPDASEPASFWEELLFGHKHPELQGSIVFPCSDDAIEFMASRRAQLARLYVLDDHVGHQQLAMLDKLATLEIAREAGVPVPRYWKVDKPEDLDDSMGELVFPVCIKPIHSHVFQRAYNKKLLLVHDAQQLRSEGREILQRGIPIMVCEFIPGPDSLLSSYYTYLDPRGEPLFHFTKRIIRRSPRHFGAGVYHITEWLPETAKMGRRFFESFGFRGLGNIEFKRDPRDGRLKVIECNARFTAAQHLLVRSDMDIAWMIYNHLVGTPLDRPDRYRQSVRLWSPRGDFDAFRELNATGELSFAGWLRSIAHFSAVPYFALTDPVPAMARAHGEFLFRLRRRISRWGS
jgi:predicted ATP-grasp superfamily ATP-dependent carboligase